MEQNKRLNRQSNPHISHSRGELVSGAKELLALCVTLTGVLWTIPALSASAECRFKADTDAVEVQVLLGGKEHWHDKIQKGETRTVTMPEGSFTIISKVYNPNLKIMEDTRTESHTRLCRQQALSVPLFTQER